MAKTPATKRIPLMRLDRQTREDRVVGHAIVDESDYERLRVHRWGMMKSGRNSYACRQQHVKGTANGNELFYLHREILGLPRGTGHSIVVDHIDYNGLNNVRSNLRVVTQAQNAQRARCPVSNKSGQAGVWFQEPKNPEHRRRACTVGYWVAQLFRDGAYIHRSSHPTKEQAIAARLQAERDYEAAKAKETA